jgi:hypothetical protein
MREMYVRNSALDGWERCTKPFPLRRRVIQLAEPMAMVNVYAVPTDLCRLD